MSAPETKREIERGIIDACPTYLLVSQRERLVDLMWGWRTEWLRDAEPRLRPVSETPARNDVVAIFAEGYAWRTTKWDTSNSFLSGEAGWILLERAKPKTLAEEALELLKVRRRNRCMLVGREAAEIRQSTDDLLRRVVEQGDKND